MDNLGKQGSRTLRSPYRQRLAARIASCVSLPSAKTLQNFRLLVNAVQEANQKSPLLHQFRGAVFHVMNLGAQIPNMLSTHLLLRRRRLIAENGIKNAAESTHSSSSSSSSSLCFEISNRTTDICRDREKRVLSVMEQYDDNYILLLNLA